MVEVVLTESNLPLLDLKTQPLLYRLGSIAVEEIEVIRKLLLKNSEENRQMLVC
jgi:hypothetical protein